jgi:hypothetical protein
MSSGHTPSHASFASRPRPIEVKRQARVQEDKTMSTNQKATTSDEARKTRSGHCCGGLRVAV